MRTTCWSLSLSPCIVGPRVDCFCSFCPEGVVELPGDRIQFTLTHLKGEWQQEECDSFFSRHCGMSCRADASSDSPSPCRVSKCMLSGQYLSNKRGSKKKTLECFGSVCCRGAGQEWVARGKVGGMERIGGQRSRHPHLNHYSARTVHARCMHGAPHPPPAHRPRNHPRNIPIPFPPLKSFHGGDLFAWKSFHQKGVDGTISCPEIVSMKRFPARKSSA
mmetsp:Transcript_112318/g.195062  ORF Transcript_112318/g.195062 Transcript_112318/m.195062 type:complete len:219 (+) Transcript_112318:812-1468(+)